MKRLLGFVLLAASLVLAGSLALSLALPARAQDAPSAETLRAAQDLAAIMTGGTVEQMTSALTEQIWPNVERQMGTKVDAGTLLDMRSEVQRLLAKFVNESLKDAPAVYARHFTAAELRELVAFYKTPTGAKTLHELPKVTAESYGLVLPRLGPFQQELSASLQAVMTKHGYKE